MISAFFISWSGWFIFLMFFVLSLAAINKKAVEVMDLFIACVLFSFLFSIPSFYGVFKLME